MCTFNDVWNSFGGAASDMTHSVCKYGNGSMAEGMRKLVRVSHKTGIFKGRKEGIMIGVGGSGAIVLTIWGVTEFIQFFKKNKKKYILTGQQKNIDSRLAKVQREIDDFYVTHLRVLTDEENEELLNLFAKKLDILKEMSDLQYRKLNNTAA